MKETTNAGHDCSLRLFEDDEGWSRAESAVSVWEQVIRDALEDQ